jgi:hypothetical protein
MITFHILLLYILNFSTICRLPMMNLLTPKFGKESDLWVRFEKESVWWKERYFQRFSAKKSAVGYLHRFGKGIVELILRDWTVTWLKSEETNGWTDDRV